MGVFFLFLIFDETRRYVTYLKIFWANIVR